MSEPAPIELSELPRLRADAFAREDEGDDAAFYRDGHASPPLDSLAEATVERVLGTLIGEPVGEPAGATAPIVLDLMAGARSHLPATVAPSRLVGLGLDPVALAANDALDERVVHDLNADPKLPFADGSFDVVLNTFAFEYLTRPFDVLDEIGRVLRPGGLVAVVVTNRKVRRKAVRVWRDISEHRRATLVREMLMVSGQFERVGEFRSVGKPRPEGDPFADCGLPSDPIYALFGDRLGGDAARPPRQVPPSEQGLDMDPERLAERKRLVGKTLRCPYCDEPLTRYEVAVTPFSEWDVDHVHVCFNNRCPYLCAGWSAMDRQGNRGFSYRLMYHPGRDRCMPTPIAGLGAQKDSVSMPRG